MKWDTTMRSRSRGTLILGWGMTLAGSGVVLFWLIYEAVTSFAHAPIETLIGVALVLALLALLVPVPLILATRRARRRPSSSPGHGAPNSR